MTRPVYVQRRPVAPGCPAWFATVTGKNCWITSAYETQEAAMAAISDLTAIMDAPPRESAVRQEGRWI